MEWKHDNRGGISGETLYLGPLKVGGVRRLAFEIGKDGPLEYSYISYLPGIREGSARFKTIEEAKDMVEQIAKYWLSQAQEEDKMSDTVDKVMNKIDSGLQWSNRYAVEPNGGKIQPVGFLTKYSRELVAMYVRPFIENLVGKLDACEQHLRIVEGISAQRMKLKDELEATNGILAAEFENRDILIAQNKRLIKESDAKSAIISRQNDAKAEPCATMTLTVILRDDGPMIHCGDSPSYRSVQVDLTQEQIAAIAPRKTGVSGGTDIYEGISKAFIEPR